MRSDPWSPSPPEDGSSRAEARPLHSPHSLPSLDAPPSMPPFGPPYSPPTRATMPPTRGHATYRWGRLAPRQQEVVWQLLRTDQTRRLAGRRRLMVLLLVLAALLAVLGALLFLLFAARA